MKNKYKVVALVPLEFSVEGSSDSKEAIESVKNIFEACRNDNDCADIVFDGIEESLRHDSIEYKVEAAQPEPEVKANSDNRSVASDICDVFENYLDENGVYIVCDDADEEQDRICETMEGSRWNGTRPLTSVSMKCRLAHWLCRRPTFRLPSFIFMMNRGRMNWIGLHVPALHPVHLVTKVLTSSSVT